MQAKDKIQDVDALSTTTQLYDQAMNEIIKCMDFKLPNEPMNLFTKNENDISNPYGKLTCLILYLYSMQIGEPPLYAELNKVCRNQD